MRSRLVCDAAVAVRCATWCPGCGLGTGTRLVPRPAVMVLAQGAHGQQYFGPRKYWVAGRRATRASIRSWSSQVASPESSGAQSGEAASLQSPRHVPGASDSQLHTVKLAVNSRPRRPPLLIAALFVAVAIPSIAASVSTIQTILGGGVAVDWMDFVHASEHVG